MIGIEALMFLCGYTFHYSLFENFKVQYIYPKFQNISFQKSLNETGRESLEKEFRTLLKRHSKPVPVVTLQDILSAMIDTSDSVSRTSADDNPIQHFSEKIMTDLGTIANWLTEHKKSTDFMSVYSQIRSSMLQASLKE